MRFNNSVTIYLQFLNIRVLQYWNIRVKISHTLNEGTHHTDTPKEADTMKREERKVYNSLKKTVTGDTLYVEIPTNWTHEARQTIHELLTVEKGMVATVIGPECCEFKETIR